MPSSVFGLVPERAQRIEHRLHGFELVERGRVVYVHDEAHAAELLEARGTLDGEEVIELARALVRGDLLLIDPVDDVPLDPPDPHAVPLLSDLVPDGGDPIALEPARPPEPIEVPETALVPILQAEDVLFGVERVVFLPEPPLPHAEDRGVTGLSFARAVLQQAYLEPEKQVVFVGHADASGSSDANLEVSRDRAENTKLFVTGQRDAWAAHCISHYAVDDVQHLLTWTATAWGWDTLPGAIDNEMGPLTEGALDRFRVAYNDELEGEIAESGPMAEADFAAFFDVMQASLAEMLGRGAPPVADLQASVLLFGEGVIACGEGWASAPVVMVGYPKSSPRRVDVLFLDEHEASLASVPSEPPLAELYGDPDAVARPLAVDPVPFSALQYEVWVELRTHFLDAVVSGVQYELVGPHPSEDVLREGVVDAKGQLRERKLASGNYQLRIDGELLPVAARIMDHHPEGLEQPSVLRFHGRDETARPIHLFASAQAGEWIVPGEEAGEEPHPEREDGA